MTKTFIHLALPTSILALGLSALPGCSAGPDAEDMGDLDAGGTALRLAEGLVSPLADLRGVAATDLSPRHVQVEDELGGSTVRFSQLIDGVPVFGGETFVHMDDNGDMVGLKDYLVADLALDTTPRLDQSVGIELAVEGSGGWDSLTDAPEAELVVLPHDGLDALAWKVQLRQLDGTEATAMPLVFIDAHTGDEVWRYNNLHTASATGTAYYDGSVAIKAYKPSGDTYYYLEDPSRHIGTFDMGNSWSSAYYVADTDTSFTDSDEEVAVQAHYAAEGVYDYFKKTHLWTGIDGAGGPGSVDSLTGSGQGIALYVNYGSGYANAYWDGTQMVFGGGDGVYFDNLATVDITGHEMTHGVTGATAAFTYYGESGALDEGYADIFGAMTERYLEGDVSDVWLMGEDCTMASTGLDAIRYIYYPSLDGYTVDHYDDLYLDPSDSGGVHTNMGIPELAFYLLSEGGKHPRYGGTTMTGIGEDKASLIAFRALKKYLGSDSDMMDARNAWLDAASDLYGAGASQYKAVMKAWNLVGVGPSSSTSTCSGYTLPFSGELAASSYKYYTKSAGASYSAGTFKAKLAGPSSADFDLFLQEKNATTGVWTTVAKSKTAGSSTESLTYAATAGTYRMYVKATSGSGDFVACMTTP